MDVGRLVFDLHSVCTFQRCCSAMTSVVHRSVRACVSFSCVRWHSVGMFRDRGMETSCSRLRDVCVGMNGMRVQRQFSAGFAITDFTPDRIRRPWDCSFVVRATRRQNVSFSRCHKGNRSRQKVANADFAARKVHSSHGLFGIAPLIGAIPYS